MLLTLTLLSLLSLLACVDRPDGPPPPHLPPSVDTAVFEPLQEAADEGRPNRRPRLTTFELGPEVITSTTDAIAKVKANDPDGGMATTRVRWLVNGEAVPGQRSNSLSHTWYQRGDRLQVEVEVSDGIDAFTSRSEQRVVENSPPSIEMPKGGFQGNPDGLQLLASDPDGDTLSYRIEDGPPGMTIDRSGVIHFSGAPDPAAAGTFNAKIIAEDTVGAYAVWPLTLTLTPGKATEQIPAN